MTIHNRIDKLRKEINKLSKERSDFKRTMEYFRADSNNNALFEASKDNYIDLDIKIVRLSNELKELEEELWAVPEKQYNSPKIAKVVELLAEHTNHYDDSVKSVIEILINVLEGLDNEY